METYTIGKVIYGFEIDLGKEAGIPEGYEEIAELIKSHFEKKTPGFLQFRSDKSYNQPRAFGVFLDEFNETSSVVLSMAKLSATEQIKDDFQKLLSNLEQQVQDFLSKIKPVELIIWATSDPDKKAIIKELSEALYNYAYAYEAWNYTGSREHREEKAYNEAILDNLESKYKMRNFHNTVEGKNAYAAGKNAYFRSCDEDREDYDPDYEMEDGLKDLLDSLE